MGNYRFHTPDGVSDMLPEVCATKRGIESKLRTLFDVRVSGDRDAGVSDGAAELSSLRRICIS